MTQIDGRRRRLCTKIVPWALGVLAGLLAAAQLVPYGREHDNPPAVNLFAWSDPAAEAIARRACYDCHSNETTWWWAAKVAPASWLIRHDVDEARVVLNFSSWSGTLTPRELRAALDDDMPPLRYTILHRGAALTAAEKQALVDGFRASLDARRAAAQPPQPAAAPPPAEAPDVQPLTLPPPPAPPVKEAKAIIASRCAGCHSAAKAASYRAAGAAEANALIDQMVKKGARLKPGQAEVLVAYYTRQE